MRVLVVTQYFWPESFRINDLAAGLRERGHEVDVLTGVPNYPRGSYFEGYGPLRPVFETRDGVRVVRVPILPRGAGSSLRLVANYLSYVVSGSILGPLLCRKAYDVILVFEVSPVTVGLVAIAMKRIVKAPIFFWVQDLWPETLRAVGAVRSPTVLRMIERLVRFIYKRCDKILIQSESFRTDVERLGAPSSSVHYFPNSAETFYRPVPAGSELREKLGATRDFIVMFAGNIGVSQDFPTILDAAEKLKDQQDIRWIILGDGRQAGWVRQEVERRGLGGQIRLLGGHPAEAMPEFFAQADVLLVTLRKEPIFALTIPSKVQSYLACGKPIIAAIEGEGSRIVRESGAGLACEPQAPAALAETVMAMYRKTDAERAGMGERGLAYFRAHFERESLLSRLEEWMRRELERPRAADRPTGKNG